MKTPKAAKARPAKPSAAEPSAVGPSTVPPAPAPPAAEVDPARLEISPKGRQSLGDAGPREKKSLVYTLTNISKAPITLRVLDLSQLLEESMGEPVASELRP